MGYLQRSLVKKDTIFGVVNLIGDEVLRNRLTALLNDLSTYDNDLLTFACEDELVFVEDYVAKIGVSSEVMPFLCSFFGGNEPVATIIILQNECSVCHKKEEYVMSDEESETFMYFYQELGRSMGYIQDIFPNVPPHIRSGCIDQYSNGFNICPECCGG